MPSSHGEHFVFDTSCLNYFARVGRLHGLQQRYAGRAHAAVEVKVELERGVAVDVAIAAAVDADWIQWEKLVGISELDTYGQVLKIVGQRGRGEAATVALAAHGKWTAVLDDGAARKYADKHDVAHTGTIGILVAAAQDRQLRKTEAWEVLEAMRTLGFRTSISREEFMSLVEGHALRP